MTGKYWDRAWNPIQTIIKGSQGKGYHCTKTSPGCQNCWAEILNKRFGNKIPFDKRHLGFEINEKPLNAPLHWKKPQVIAVQWMGDLFHEDVPNNFIEAAFGQMALAKQHTFLVLTKRAKRMSEWVSRITPHLVDTDERSIGAKRFEYGEEGWPLDNLYLGVTVCNQAEADEKIPLLLQTPAAHRWVSIEPMLGPINLERYLFSSGDDGEPAPRNEPPLPCLHCVVLGGETGPGARPMHPDWVRFVRDQCQEAGVPFFFKQWGRHEPDLKDMLGDIKPENTIDIFTTKYDRYLDGREHNELPWREVKDVR